MDRSPHLAIQVVLQQQSKIARQEMEKPFLFSPLSLNSSNFQHFGFMSVKSLMNFQWLPEKEQAVGVIFGNWSSNITRVNQEIKRNGGPPRITQKTAYGTR